MEEVLSKSVPINEQETTISFMRDESFAMIYTSDSTMITKIEKLRKTNPDTYMLVKDLGCGKFYKVLDKTLISLRSKKVKREMTEEQRQAASDRLRKAREKVK